MAGSSAELSISFTEVRQKAINIRNQNKALRDALDKFQRTINSLEGKYISDAATKIQEKANALTSKFTKYEEDIAAYATFLDKTVQTWETLEGTLQQNASSLYE